MKDLQQLRKELDVIDAQIVEHKRQNRNSNYYYWCWIFNFFRLTCS